MVRLARREKAVSRLRSGVRWRGVVSVVLPASAALLFAGAAWGRRWMSEDAFINLRVVRNVLEGHGPVFNLGERVEIFTSPLWVSLQAVGGAILPLELEWIAVGGGLALSLGGLGAATAGALAASRQSGDEIVLPFGLLVVAALPPFWDYATSGLETGLTFAWIGASFWGLTVVRPGRSSLAVAVLAGLGPLVRPDLSLFAVPVLVALVVVLRPGRRELVRMGCAAAAIPVAYQLFRMGYYAALFPNTALAKEAFEGRWGQGLVYAEDLLSPYRLWVPLLPLGIWWTLRLTRARRERAWTVEAPALAMLAGAGLHALYVVGIGGDFMHGRLLLPALFALLAPVAVVRVGRSPERWLLVAAVAVWAIASVSFLRLHYSGVGPDGIADERRFWAGVAGDPHPVTLEDYGDSWFVRTGREANERIGGPEVLILPVTFETRELREYPMSPSAPAEVAVFVQNAGILGYAAEPAVHLVDGYGLGDALGARLEMDERGRPGHEKILPTAWVTARLGHRERTPPPGDPSQVAAARAALDCEPLRTLSKATRDRLTPGRVLHNVWSAARLTLLRVPPDPREAETRFC